MYTLHIIYAVALFCKILSCIYIYIYIYTCVHVVYTYTFAAVRDDDAMSSHRALYISLKPKTNSTVRKLMRILKLLSARDRLLYANQHYSLGNLCRSCNAHITNLYTSDGGYFVYLTSIISYTIKVTIRFIRLYKAIFACPRSRPPPTLIHSYTGHETKNPK